MVKFEGVFKITLFCNEHNPKLLFKIYTIRIFNLNPTYNNSHSLYIFLFTRCLSSFAARLQLSLAAFSIAGPTSLSYLLNNWGDIVGISAHANILFSPAQP